MRTGICDMVLIDHDRVENRNLDRTLYATARHAETHVSKVDLAADAATDSHTAETITIRRLPENMLTAEWVAALLDCDVIVSCVDRPWPRWLLNTVSYTQLFRCPALGFRGNEQFGCKLAHRRQLEPTQPLDEVRREDRRSGAHRSPSAVGASRA